MIDRIIEELSPAQQLVLLNAVAFEDQWSAQYKKNQVKKEYFTDQNGKKTKTDLMYSEETLYCQDDMATGFIKPYASGYQFVAILPNKGVSVAAYMKKLDGERFAAFVNSGQDAIVHAVLPAFKSEYKTDALVQIFRKMGLRTYLTRPRRISPVWETAADRICMWTRFCTRPISMSIARARARRL